MEAKPIIINLKALRETHDISQSELAEKLGISRQSIISIEQGKFFPSLPVAVDLCNFFNKAFEEIFSLDSEDKKENHQINIKIIPRKENQMPGFMEPWRPLKDSLSLREAMDRLMEDSFVTPRNMTQTTRMSAPKINVLEKGNDVIVRVEVPGINEEDLDIEVSDDTVAISGERKEEKEVKEEDYYHKETHYGSFARSITLPTQVIGDKANADMKNGVLTITIPKVEEKKAKKIKLKASVK